jgi:hypothetical protein
VRYALKTPYRDGTTRVVFEPLDFLPRRRPSRTARPDWWRWRVGARPGIVGKRRAWPLPGLVVGEDGESVAHQFFRTESGVPPVIEPMLAHGNA